MRVTIAAIAFLLCAAAVGVSAAPAPSVPTHATAQGLPAASVSPALASHIKAWSSSYRAHRAGFATVSQYSENVRHNRWLALAGILLFALLTLPRSARGVRDFYRQMISASPLPDVPGASADDVQRARAVLFFYLLFLLYQLVSFPLTLGRDNIVQFTADLIFQIVSLAALIWSYHRLKRHLRAEWRNDPERRAKMDLWLNEKLAGMNIRWRDIQKLALGVFVAGFAPVTLAHMTVWLDALSALGDHIAGA